MNDACDEVGLSNSELRRYFFCLRKAVYGFEDLAFGILNPKVEDTYEAQALCAAKALLEIQRQYQRLALERMTKALQYDSFFINKYIEMHGEQHLGSDLDDWRRRFVVWVRKSST